MLTFHKSIKDILQICEQSIINFFNWTLEQMNKKISDIIRENDVQKNEVVSCPIFSY